MNNITLQQKTQVALENNNYDDDDDNNEQKKKETKSRNPSCEAEKVHNICKKKENSIYVTATHSLYLHTYKRPLCHAFYSPIKNYCVRLCVYFIGLSFIALLHESLLRRFLCGIL